MTGTGEMAVAQMPARRCPVCGRRAITDGRCLACQTDPMAHRTEMVPATPPQVFDLLGQPLATAAERSIAPLPQANAAVPIPNKRTPALAWQRQPRRLFGPSEVAGRVLVVRQGPHEPMDFDPWRWIAIPAWGMLLLLSPLVAAIVTWQSAGFLPTLGVAAISLLVLRYMFSDRLLQGWYFAAALNGRHVVEHMPVAMIRLRQADGREVQLHVKGVLSGGAVMEGDRVRAIGAWRFGVLRVRRISCDRTGAMITPRQPNAFGLALAGLCSLLLVGLWLWFAGIPWATDQAALARASLRSGLPSIPTLEDAR